jgi:hypothetical protein
MNDPRRLRWTAIVLAVALACGCYGSPDAVNGANFTHGGSSPTQGPAQTNSAPGAVTGVTVTPQGLDTLCLDAGVANPQEGDPVKVAVCSGSGAQRWTYIKGQLRMPGDKCIDVPPGAPAARGTHLAVRTCDPNSPSQHWIIDRGIIYADGVGSMQLATPSAAAGSAVQLADVNFGDVTQQWAVGLTVPGTGTQPVNLGFAATASTVPGLCLDGASANVGLVPCEGPAAQAWTWQPSGLLQTRTGCLTLALDASNGAPLQLAACNPALDTQFWVSEIGHIVSKNYKCLEVDGNATRVIANDCAFVDTQLWNMGSQPLRATATPP